MDISSHTPYTDLNKAARKAADAHNAVRVAIQEHAQIEAEKRQQDHATLAAENQLKLTSG